MGIYFVKDVKHNYKLFPEETAWQASYIYSSLVLALAHAFAPSPKPMKHHAKGIIKHHHCAWGKVTHSGAHGPPESIARVDHVYKSHSARAKARMVAWHSRAFAIVQ